MAVVSAVGTLRFFRATTCGTALGLIGEAFRLEKLLFPGAEGKSNPTIGTLDGLVLKTQLDDLLSFIS
jgi:hypothetical protein